MTTYDDWKTTDPAEYGEQCCFCGGTGKLTIIPFKKTERWICRECLDADPDAERDWQFDD